MADDAGGSPEAVDRTTNPNSERGLASILPAGLRAVAPMPDPKSTRSGDHWSEQVADRPYPERAVRPVVGQEPATGTPLPPAQTPFPPAVVRSTMRTRVVVGRLDVQVNVASTAPTARPSRPPGPAARDPLAARYLDRFGLG